MSLPSFQLLRPRTVDETMGFLAKYPGETKIVAGGTDLLPSMKQKLFTPPYLLDLRSVSELSGIASERCEALRSARSRHSASSSTRR